MIVVTACKAAAVAVVGSLAFHSGRNMVETRQICASVGAIAKPGTTGPQATSVTNSRSSSAPTTVEGLQKMNRAELIELFMHHCEAPRGIEEIEGQWNGVLLKNNGLVSEFARTKTNELIAHANKKLTPCHCPIVLLLRLLPHLGFADRPVSLVSSPIGCLAEDENGMENGLS